MAYGFVQDAVNAAASVTLGSSVTAGHLLVGMGQGSGATTAIAFADGTNTYAQPTNTVVLAQTTTQFFFYVLSAAAGATTITATPTGGTVFRMYVAEYSGIASYLNTVQNDQNPPSIGTNTVVSGNYNFASVPALLWAMAFDYSYVGTNFSAGTSPIAFNGRTAGDTSYLPEDARITVSGNAQATFGTTVSNQNAVTVLLAFAESTIAASAGTSLLLLGV